MKFLELISEQKNIKNDAIFTKPSIAKYCIDKVGVKSFARVIEPSAGNGSFSSQIPNCEAMDIDPQHHSIKKADFLSYNTPKGNILVIGNPPFGKNNDLTMKFINHAAKFARTIAFVLPKSCQKETFINRLDKNVHLRRVIQLPKKSFLIDGNETDIKCNFFIFDVKESERKDIERPSTSDFYFTKKELCDFAILRKGYKVGRLIDRDDTHFSDASKYYIKSNIGVDELKRRLSMLTYPEAGMVIGSDSISQLEIMRAYVKRFGKPTTP